MAEKTRKAPSPLRALQTAAKGLLYPSESDKPIKAFVWKPEETKGVTTAEEAIVTVTGADKASLRGVSLAAFFQPLTMEQAWHGEEEQAAVAKARALLNTLTKTLSEVEAYRMDGGAHVAVYVIGKDAAGNWAGVQTTLVET